MERNSIYFCSDMHFGVDGTYSSKFREKLFVHWLEHVATDATDIFLLGDIFDFWFEWKYVIPKGYTRMLGTITRLIDNGVQIHFFTGNHDVWMFSYFQNELGIKVYTENTIMVLQGKKCFLSHGDGFDKDDIGYTFLKFIFKNKFFQRIFASLHPYIATQIATRMSKTSRIINQQKNIKDKSRKEKLTNAQIAFAQKKLEEIKDIDFFIFGHQHFANDILIGTKTKIHIIGNWIEDFNYLRMKGGIISRHNYKDAVIYFSE